MRPGSSRRRTHWTARSEAIRIQYAVIAYAAALSAAGYRAFAAAGLMAGGRTAALAVIRDAAKILETLTGDATAERVRWTIKQTRSARSCEEHRDRVLAMLAEAMKEGADHA